MQEEYSGRLMEDGRLSIPKGIIEKLNISRESTLRVTVRVVKKTKKEKILAYAGLLSDMTKKEEKRFGESIKRRSPLRAKRSDDMKRCTLDTNIITAFMKNDSAVVRKISDYLEVFDALTINIISYYEILRGLKDLGKADKLRKFEEFMQENELISIRKETVQKAAEIYAYLKKGGNFDRRRRHFNSLYCSCRRFNSCH